MWRSISWLLLAGLVAAGLSFAAAPWFAFRALKAAARDGDVQALAELVDYPAVRTGLRAELAEIPTPAAAPPDIWSDPVGAVRRAIEPLTPAPPAVERYMAPAGLHALACGHEAARAAAEAACPAPSLRYWGPNRVRLAVAGFGSQPVVFSFQRRGAFTWKLVQVHLPPRSEATP
jgi:hypothetical protein